MQEDDYGIETIEDKSTTQSGNTGTAASAEVKGVTDKMPAKENVSAPVKLEKKPVVEDDDDEEDPYAAANVVKKVNDKAAIQENMQNLTIDKTFRPKDMYAMFLGTDFLYLDFESDTWQMGDVASESGDLNPVFLIPENTAIVRLDDKEPSCKHTNFIVIGGCQPSGTMCEWHFGVQVTKENDRMLLDVGYSMQQLNLPFPRMLHEACLVKNENNEWRLLVIGGKMGKHAASASFTNSVMALDMKYVLSPWLAEKKGAAMPEWKSVAGMASARASFAHIVIANTVYVYGGISGQGKKAHSHHPTLAAPPIEQYCPVQDKWTTFEINNVPSLAGFAWTSMGHDSGQLMVLGGSDGSVLTEGQFLIDFKKAECTELVEHEFENQFAMNKLVLNKKMNKLYSFGGYGSGGQNFELTLKPKETWQESKRSHAAILAVKQAESPGTNVLELVNYSGILFD